MRRVLTVIAIAATGLMPMPATAQTTYTCLGEPATIVGTEENDLLHGTTGSDVMVGLGDLDHVYGRAEDSSLPDEGDLICGGAGIDRVAGYGGNDVVAGNASNDAVTGDEGADRLAGGAGDDQVYGGAGHDWSRGGPDNDRIVDTSTGADQLYGDGGNDSIDAANRQTVHKPDFIDGGDGRDTCTVNEEDEVVSCEDVFVIRP